MYANLQNCVRVGRRLTDWFSQSAGVRQGDALAPTHFALFINDLVSEINGLSCGVPMTDDKFLSILLYADDIVLISGTTEGLQKQLNGLNDWSSRWKLRVNTDKTNVVHFRRNSDTATDHVFTLGNSPQNTESSYRCLRMNINDGCELWGYKQRGRCDVAFLRRPMNRGTRITGQLQQPTTSLHTWPIA